MRLDAFSDMTSNTVVGFAPELYHLRALRYGQVVYLGIWQALRPLSSKKKHLEIDKLFEAFFWIPMAASDLVVILLVNKDEYGLTRYPGISEAAAKVPQVLGPGALPLPNPKDCCDRPTLLTSGSRLGTKDRGPSIQVISDDLFAQDRYETETRPTPTRNTHVYNKPCMLEHWFTRFYAVIWTAYCTNLLPGLGHSDRLIHG